MAQNSLIMRFELFTRLPRSHKKIENALVSTV
jgi:hypothetical protein